MKKQMISTETSVILNGRQIKLLFPSASVEFTKRYLLRRKNVATVIEVKKRSK